MIRMFIVTILSASAMTYIDKSATGVNDRGLSHPTIFMWILAVLAGVLSFVYYLEDRK